LASYAPRYAPVAVRAGVDFPLTTGEVAADVVERAPGSGTTDFGAPGTVPQLDHRPVTAAEARAAAELLRASWAVFDEVAATAPAELRKGPRGGGRDRDKIVAHVLESEAGYARIIGIRRPAPAPADQASIAGLRAEILAVLGEPSDGSPVAGRKWPARYAARRFAWHVLDHAWEIEDRSE
jgi:hypothetical protein